MSLHAPVGYRVLLRDLRNLRLPPGRPILVHCAMSSLGHIVGGPTTMLRAIRDATGGAATIVVPTQTANNSTTSRYYLADTAGMDDDARARYEAELPGFDPSTTPSYRMGALSEYVRQRPMAVRSIHPQTSFAAVGPHAADLLRTHELASHLGDESPLAALYRADGVSLLLGVGFDRCTALHLAEYRVPGLPRKTYTCFVRRAGGVERLSFEALDLDDRDFDRLGAELAAHTWVRTGVVGNGRAHVVPIRPAVNFATSWISHNRAHCKFPGNEIPAGKPSGNAR